MDTPVVDGMKADRVLHTPPALQIDLRPAEIADARQIWLWRNEPEARRCSFCADFIPWESHLAWFREKLRDAREAFLIAAGAAKQRPVGYVRFTLLEGGCAEIGIVIDPLCRGRGCGGAVLACALGWAAQRLPARRVLARIKPSNLRSISLFWKAGFRPVPGPSGAKTGALEMAFDLDGREA